MAGWALRSRRSRGKRGRASSPAAGGAPEVSGVPGGPGVPGAYERWLFSLVRAHVWGRVLEVQSGAGRYTCQLATKASYLLAIDPSEERVREIDRRLTLPGRVDCALGELEELPPPREARDQFDTVVSFAALDRTEDDVAVLRRMVEQTRPGGRVVVVVPAMPSALSRREREAGRRRYTARTLRVAMEVAGLEWGGARYVHRLGYAGCLLRRLLRRPPDDATPTRLVWLGRLVDRLLPLPMGSHLVAVGKAPGGDVVGVLKPVKPPLRRAA